MAGAVLLAQAASLQAAPGDCGQVTVRQVQPRPTRPAACIAVQLNHATVLLDKALTEAHARALVAAHPDDAHRSRWTARQARDLLQAMTPRAALASCAHVDGREGGSDWLFYVALQIDQGWAAVQPSGSSNLVGAVAVRERSMGCTHTLGDTATRVYSLPSGQWFLPLVVAIS